MGMTRAELAGYVGLRVRFDFDATNERYEHFDLLRGIDCDVAIWGESLGTQFIPLADIRGVEVESRNVWPHLFEEARSKLEAAGFTLGPDMRGAMMAIRRSSTADACCWIDTVNTVRIVGDHESDPTGEVFRAVCAAL